METTTYTGFPVFIFVVFMIALVVKAIMACVTYYRVITAIEKTLDKMLEKSEEQK